MKNKNLKLTAVPTDYYAQEPFIDYNPNVVKNRLLCFYFQQNNYFLWFQGKLLKTIVALQYNQDVFYHVSIFF